EQHRSQSQCGRSATARARAGPRRHDPDGLLGGHLRRAHGRAVPPHAPGPV
ncbi:MAG: hypothetical protein AVDCRST_MAG60-725, partial [uncultured Nocardioides sp.]